MRVKLLLLGIIIVTRCFGQQYASFPTTNAFWTTSHCTGPFFPVTGLLKAGVFGDTTFNDKIYHKKLLVAK